MSVSAVVKAVVSINLYAVHSVQASNSALCDRKTVKLHPTKHYTFDWFRQPQWAFKSLQRVLLHQNLEHCIYPSVACCCELSILINEILKKTIRILYKEQGSKFHLYLNNICKLQSQYWQACLCFYLYAAG